MFEPSTYIKALADHKVKKWFEEDTTVALSRVVMGWRVLPSFCQLCSVCTVFLDILIYLIYFATLSYNFPAYISAHCAAIDELRGNDS